MGPVPVSFNTIFEYLTKKDILTVNYTYYSDGGVGGQYKPFENRTFNKALFTDKELNVLELIAERFKETCLNILSVISFCKSNEIYLSNPNLSRNNNILFYTLANI
jgi:hypothetical protein